MHVMGVCEGGGGGPCSLYTMDEIGVTLLCDSFEFSKSIPGS